MSRKRLSRFDGCAPSVAGMGSRGGLERVTGALAYSRGGRMPQHKQPDITSGRNGDAQSGGELGAR